jgi:hypothetical protein
VVCAAAGAIPSSAPTVVSATKNPSLRMELSSLPCLCSRIAEPYEVSLSAANLRKIW